MEDDNAAGVQRTCLNSAARSGAESQGNVGHGEHDNTLVLGGVLGDTTQMGLDNVIAVQEGELAGGLDPDLWGLLADVTRESLARPTGG